MPGCYLQPGLVILLRHSRCDTRSTSSCACCLPVAALHRPDPVDGISEWTAEGELRGELGGEREGGQSVAQCDTAELAFLCQCPLSTVPAACQARQPHRRVLWGLGRAAAAPRDVHTAATGYSGARSCWELIARKCRDPDAMDDEFWRRRSPPEPSKRQVGCHTRRRSRPRSPGPEASLVIQQGRSTTKPSDLQQLTAPARNLFACLPACHPDQNPFPLHRIQATSRSLPPHHHTPVAASSVTQSASIPFQPTNHSRFNPPTNQTHTTTEAPPSTLTRDRPDVPSPSHPPPSTVSLTLFLPESVHRPIPSSCP